MICPAALGSPDLGLRRAASNLSFQGGSSRMALASALALDERFQR